MNIESLRKDMVAAMKRRTSRERKRFPLWFPQSRKQPLMQAAREDIPEDMVDRVILKELKTAKEQIDTCPESRTDLKEEYQFRYDVISEYAPKLLSAEEVKAILTEKFADVHGDEE